MGASDRANRILSLRGTHGHFARRGRGHRSELGAAAVGRLHGDPRGGRRLRAARRHPRQLGAGVRLHGHAARRDRRRGLHRLHLRHHRGWAGLRPDRLRQAGHRGLRVARAVGGRDPRRELAGQRLPHADHRHVPVRDGERRARGGGQPAGRDALPQRPHALPQPAARRVARRPDPRHGGRLGAGRQAADGLARADHAVPRAHRGLRADVLRAAHAALGGLEAGRRPRRHVQGRRAAGHGGGLLPALAVLRGQPRAVPDGVLADLGLAAAAGRLDDPLRVGLRPALRAVHRARAGGG
jgi:hypothetical protein